MKAEFNLRAEKRFNLINLVWSFYLYVEVKISVWVYPIYVSALRISKFSWRMTPHFGGFTVRVNPYGQQENYSNSCQKNFV
jgi:hypothetical protein